MKSRSAGFSLIELMVALAISTFLLLGVFQVYISLNDTARSGSALARLQENGRFAVNYLIQNLRLAGYQGCIDTSSVEVNVLAVNANINTNIIPLQGFRVAADGVWSPARPAQADELNINGGPLNDSDVVYIQHATASSTNVTCPGGICAANQPLPVDNLDLGLGQGGTVIVTDCDSADMFRITNDLSLQLPGNFSLEHDGTLNTGTGDFNNSYTESASKDVLVMGFLANAFYVKDTGRDTAQGNDIFALFKYDRQLRAEFEVVEGIERLIVLYGERLPTDAVRFVAADDATLNMGNVVALRVAVMATSNDAVKEFDDTTRYSMLDTDVLPNTVSGAASTYQQDRRLRKVFSATLQLRN